MDYAGDSSFTSSNFMPSAENGIQNSLGTRSEDDDSYMYKKWRKEWWPMQHDLLVDSFQIKQVNENMI